MQFIDIIKSEEFKKILMDFGGYGAEEIGRIILI
jgi:hypothetical protein